MSVEKDCPDCGGITGQVNNGSGALVSPLCSCSTCKGTGKVLKDNGSRLRPEGAITVKSADAYPPRFPAPVSSDQNENDCPACGERVVPMRSGAAFCTNERCAWARPPQPKKPFSVPGVSPSSSDHGSGGDEARVQEIADRVEEELISKGEDPNGFWPNDEDRPEGADYRFRFIEPAIRAALSSPVPGSIPGCPACHEGTNWEGTDLCDSCEGTGEDKAGLDARGGHDQPSAGDPGRSEDENAIQRWGLDYYDHPPKPTKDPNGDFVRFEDHEAALRRLAGEQQPARSVDAGGEAAPNPDELVTKTESGGIAMWSWRSGATRVFAALSPFFAAHPDFDRVLAEFDEKGWTITEGDEVEARVAVSPEDDAGLRARIEEKARGVGERAAHARSKAAAHDAGTDAHASYHRIARELDRQADLLRSLLREAGEGADQ